MNTLSFIKKELNGWGKWERIIFPLEILFIILLSFYLGDNKVALVSAICGISYTILSGKGKISCYFFGLLGTFCYSWIAYKNHLFGNLILYSCYYFPMQTIGIFKWKEHLRQDSQEIEKTCLSLKEKVVFAVVGILASTILAIFLLIIGDPSPIIDSITTVFSVIGLFLTVRRCIEQWYLWAIVNGLSVFMWVEAYINGSNCLATVIMWVTYFVLSFYFLHTWNRDLKK